MFRIFARRFNMDRSASGWSDIYSLSGKLFRYAFIDRGSYIDIAIQTPKSPRGESEDSSYSLTHKLPLKDGRNIDKICFNAGKEPKTLEKAVQVLQEYIELYSTWLDTGKSIDQQIQEMRNFLFIKLFNMKTKILHSSLKMTQSVSEKIRQTLGTLKAETGGLGFGLKEDMIVRKFFFDPRLGTDGTYTLNSVFFNPIIKKLYEEEGLEPLMIAHSHPPGFLRPSLPDIEIGKKYLHRFEVDILYFPLIFSRADNPDYFLLPYAFSTVNQGTTFVKMSSTEIIPDQWVEPDKAKKLESFNVQKSESKTESVAEFELHKPDIDFSRVEQAISISKMKESHILVVGTGGSASFCKQIARLGVGRLTLIDPDLCGIENIPRQSFLLHSALTKQPKVIALKDEIKKINPAVTVTAIQDDFTKMSDATLDKLLENVDIVLMLTDSFACQAFGNKVVLKYQKIGVWAGYYTLSRAAELFFYIPGITESCFRCAVSSRYEAQAKRRIKISSSANTIFHSNLLDSYIGFIVLAILHNDIDGYEFSRWFKPGFKHNLIQFKTSPLYNGIFKELHRDKPQFFNFGAVWQEVLRETVANGYNHNCIDCTAEENQQKTTKLNLRYKIRFLKLPAIIKRLFSKK